MFKLTVVDNHGNARTDFIPDGPNGNYDEGPARGAFNMACAENETLYAVVLEWEPSLREWCERNRYARDAEFPR